MRTITWSSFIHLFYDGNGRTSRLLMNFLQAKFDLHLAIVYSENKAAYIEAIIKTKETEDPTHFREFMLSEYIVLLQGGSNRYGEMKQAVKGQSI